jgi:ATP-dependent exoDNAse (exonuclease V) alpha subunit
VNALNALDFELAQASGKRGYVVHAVDRHRSGAVVTNEEVRRAIERKSSGQLMQLGLYLGMDAMLTFNADAATDNINGSAGRVVGIGFCGRQAVLLPGEDGGADGEGDAASDVGGGSTSGEGSAEESGDEEEPTFVYFRPHTAAPEAAPLRIGRRRHPVRLGTNLVFYRSQLPLLPAHAGTIHRQQGATLDDDIHIPFHGFFAEGQVYTAMSRARRLEQLHLWGFDRKAIVAEPEVAREYGRLCARRLTTARVRDAPPQCAPALTALSRAVRGETV